MKAPGIPETARAPAVGELGRHEAAMRETVERARREIPFYAEHHRKTPSLDLHALPTCDKADLAPFGRLPLSARPLSEMYRVSATSGTTGPRLFIGYSATPRAGRGSRRSSAAPTTPSRCGARSSTRA